MQKLSACALLPVLLAVLLAGCATTANEREVLIADGLRFALQSPASFGANVLLTQVATLRFGDAVHELLLHIEIGADRLAIVGSQPGGTRLFSIEWDGETLRSDGYGEVLDLLRPAYFVADLQLAQWPFAVVAEALAQANSCFAAGSCRFTESGAGLQRRLDANDQQVIVINYSALPIYRYATHYAHLARGYRLEVETLALEATDSP
jgi:hypothetical protein